MGHALLFNNTVNVILISFGGRVLLCNEVLYNMSVKYKVMNFNLHFNIFCKLCSYFCIFHLKDRYMQVAV